jgi:cysteine desulfurase
MEKEVYCDHGATTPLDPRVEAAMRPYWRERFGNPSSLHRGGQRARAAVEQARRSVARAIGAAPEEIVFTGSATEANNLAVRGVLAADRCRAGTGCQPVPLPARQPAHFVTSCIEHACVGEACRQIERTEGGCSTTVVACGESGVVRCEDVRAALRPETVLAAVMFVNNETGMIQPVLEIGRMLRERGVRFLCDAVQAMGRVPVSVQEIPCDFLALSSHKIYGPQGVGALYVRGGGAGLEPMIVGGGQERGLRAGTENVAGIVGFATAVELAVQEQTARRAHLEQCEAAFLDELQRGRIEWQLNGAMAPRAPGILNVSFPALQNRDLLIALDLEGIAVSAGSACSSGFLETSHVLAGMGLCDARSRTALRFSFGMSNTVDEARWVGGKVAELVRRRSR